MGNEIIKHDKHGGRKSVINFRIDYNYSSFIVTSLLSSIDNFTEYSNLIII